MEEFEEKKRILAESSVFKGLDEDILSYLSKIAELREYPPESIIIEEDSMGDSLFVVSKGIVQILKTKSKGAFKTLAILKDGEFFGEMSLIDSAPRSASVKAITEVRVVVVEKQALESLFETNPKAFAKILHSIALEIIRRLRNTDKELLNMAKHNFFL